MNFSKKSLSSEAIVTILSEAVNSNKSLATDLTDMPFHLPGRPSENDI